MTNFICLQVAYSSVSCEDLFASFHTVPALTYMRFLKIALRQLSKLGAYF